MKKQYFMEYAMSAKAKRVCLDIIEFIPQGEAEGSRYIFARKNSSLKQELALAIKVSALEDILNHTPENEFPDISKHTLFDALFMEKRNLFSTSPYESVHIHFDEPMLIDLTLSEKAGFTTKSIGGIAFHEGSRIQSILNSRFEDRGPNRKTYLDYTSFVQEHLSNSPKMNSVWKEIYKDRMSPHYQVGRELDEAEATRRDVNIAMHDLNFSLSDALEYIKFGATPKNNTNGKDTLGFETNDPYLFYYPRDNAGINGIFGNAASQPTSVPMPHSPAQETINNTGMEFQAIIHTKGNEGFKDLSSNDNDLLDKPLQTAINSGLFKKEEGEHTDYESFLRNSMYNHEVTLREIYDEVKTSPQALTGKFRNVGPKISERLADKIIRSTEKLISSTEKLITLRP